jgi:alpha-1,2-mannosyltransferase
MGLILYPLSELPRIQMGDFTLDCGALAWFLIKVGLTTLAFWWCVQLVQEPGQAFPAWAQAALLLFSLRPIIGDLSHGNVNLLILFLVIATLAAFRRGWDFSAGLTLALAITCKVTPALFVPYFLWKRAWKTVLGCAVGLVLFFYIVPGCLLGFERTETLTKSWVQTMILPYTMNGVVTTEHNNQSLPGLLYRLFTHSPSFLDEDDQPVAYNNLLDLQPNQVRWLVKILGISFLALMCWRCRTPIQPRTQSRLAAEYAVIVLGMLLFSERTWKHHCVTLLLPFAVLCYQATTAQLTRGQRYWLWGAMGLAVALMTTTSTSLWEDFFDWKMGAKLAQAYGAYVLADLVLLSAVLWVLRSPAKTTAALSLPRRLPSAIAA